MMIKRQVPFKVKEITESGEFSAYASVFDVTDSHGDVVVKGAFERSIAEHEAAGTKPKFLLQHDTANIIGRHTLMREDDVGLYIEGEFFKDEPAIPDAAKAYALAKLGELQGVSIGFSLYENGESYDQERGVWLLTGINLWENSLVTFASNPDAKVESVKSTIRRGETPAARHMEKALRGLGLSTSQAKKFMSGGYKMLDEEQGLIAEIENITARLRGE